MFVLSFSNIKSLLTRHYMMAERRSFWEVQEEEKKNLQKNELERSILAYIFVNPTMNPNICMLTLQN